MATGYLVDQFTQRRAKEELVKRQQELTETALELLLKHLVDARLSSHLRKLVGAVIVEGRIVTLEMLESTNDDFVVLDIDERYSLRNWGPQDTEHIIRCSPSKCPQVPTLGLPVIEMVAIDGRRVNDQPIYGEFKDTIPIGREKTVEIHTRSREPHYYKAGGWLRYDVASLTKKVDVVFRKNSISERFDFDVRFATIAAKPRREDGTFVWPYDDYLLPGQGFAMYWTPKKPNEGKHEETQEAKEAT